MRKGKVSVMSEPPSAPASSKGDVPWWIRLCRWLWKLSAFLGISVVLALVINVISTWLTSPGGKIPNDAPLSTLMRHWPLVLLVGVCLGLLAALLGAISRWKHPSAASARAITPQERVHMLGRLRLYYEQMPIHTLQDDVRLDLGLASRPAAIQNAVHLTLRLPDQPNGLLPPGTSIVEVYERAQHELLILGEPGAGKSTRLLELAHYLLRQAEQDEMRPLPIIVPLSSWANHRLPLQDWLIEQIKDLYDVSRHLSRQWVEAGQALPLLDGLDEMEEAARPACVAAINAYHREHLHPLVVCSRTNEYEAATTRERLALHTAVVVQPLSREQVDAHLTNLINMGEPLTALRATLRKNMVLQQLATTPLMVQVLMRTYHGTTIPELSQKGPQLRKQIWDDYVQQMVSHKGNAERYPPHDTIIWLSFLARQMRQHKQTIFFLERLQPDWLPKRERVFYGLSVALLFGLLFGLLGGLFTGLFFAVSLFFLNGFLFSIPSSEKSKLNLVNRPLRHLYLGLTRGLRDGLVGALVGAFIVMLTTLWTLSTGPVGTPDDPDPGLFGFIYISHTGLTDSLHAALYGAWYVGLFVGLMGLLAGGLGAMILHYILRFWLSYAHTFPWKVVPFLEDATKHILLRRVGRGYSFRHRLLLDYFADL